MAISQRLKAFLESSRIKYSVTVHPVAYTAQEIAAAQHVPGRQLAKSVLVLTNNGPALAVLPAIHLIDLKKLKALLRAKTLTIAKEAEIKIRFPDVEIGAMSPFGNLYDIPVALDRGLGMAEEIVFNGGSHSETVKLSYRDFVTHVKPTEGTFGRPISKPTRAAPSKKKRVKRKRTMRRGVKTKRRASSRSKSRPRRR